MFPWATTRAAAVWMLAWRFKEHDPRLVPRPTRYADPELPLCVRASSGNRPHRLLTGVLSPMPPARTPQAGARHGDTETSQILDRPTNWLNNCGWPFRTSDVPPDRNGQFNHSSGPYNTRFRSGR